MELATLWVVWTLWVVCCILLPGSVFNSTRGTSPTRALWHCALVRYLVLFEDLLTKPACPDSCESM